MKSTVHLKISCNQDSVNDKFVLKGYKSEHCQFWLMMPALLKPEYLNIDSFKVDITWKARSINSWEQPYVEKFTVDQLLNEVQAIMAHVELEGQDVLKREILNSEVDSEENDDLSHCFTLVTEVAANSMTQQSDIIMMSVSECQDPESSAELDTNDDAAILINIKLSNKAEDVSASKSFLITELQSIRKQDDQKHEINNIIDKEESNDELYY